MLSSLCAYSQPYENSVGLRTAYGMGATYKHYITDRKAMEGILAVRWGGVVATAILEKHNHPKWGNSWSWYYGGGAHIGYHSRKNFVNPARNEIRDPHINIGIDGIIGIEYAFLNLPLNLSIDYNPSWDFSSNRFFVGEGLGFSVRYILRRKSMTGGG